MTTYFLLRHGERISRTEDTLLSAIGIKQAQLTARYFQNHDIHTIFTSPSKRTQQTANIISEIMHIPMIADVRLIERMLYESCRDGSFDQFLIEWDKTMEDRNYKPKYGDSSLGAGKRFKRFLDELQDGRNYLIIAHGGVIGDVLQNIFPSEHLPFRIDPKTNGKWIEISECSITEIHKSHERFSLKRVNDTSHLHSTISYKNSV